MRWSTEVVTVVALVTLVTLAEGARELDPAACAARFDVQRDKIIRTEESREMGARYLSELDVGARHECLRLCCETEACDVFVYEEKGPGSCYLFECGPPEDFRCKFTAHSNFSSGVLALSRRLAELQDQELRAHHERDLTNLRIGSSTTVSTTTAMRGLSAVPRHPPVHPHPSNNPDSPASPHPQEPPRRCSRYQFECRRGGECIAVYNACDGVPQCADGSDEAPELGCPAPAVPPPALATTLLPTTLHAPIREEVVEHGEGGESGERGVGAGRSLWPHRLAQAQPQYRYTVPESAVSSHIFSHKGGLVQEPESAYEPVAAPAPAAHPAPAPVAPPLWSRRPWPLQPLQLQPGMESIPEERGWSGAGYWTDPDPRRAWPVPQQRPDPDMPVYLPPKTMPEIPVQYGVQRQQLRDGPKKGFDLNTKPEPTEIPRPLPHSQLTASHPQPNEEKQPLETETTKKKLDKVKVSQTAASKSGETDHGPGMERHYTVQEHEGHDGLSERPPAAVLLLVLGVLMTSVLGAMIGCRARAARRRLRRGKSSFAHDADYLVNGMYL